MPWNLFFSLYKHSPKLVSTSQNCPTSVSPLFRRRSEEDFNFEILNRVLTTSKDYCISSVNSYRHSALGRVFVMKPIGTITNYFPFLEEETINVLRSVMEEASDYYDFVVRIGNKVCDEDVSLELAYIAALHVYLARARKLQEKLREKFGG